MRPRPAGDRRAATRSNWLRWAWVLWRRARPIRLANSSNMRRGMANRSSARGRARAAARSSRLCRFDAPERGAREPGAEIADRRDQLRAHRHRHLGRGARRRRALVGGEVDQREVGFVTDGGDERNVRGSRGTHHDLLVEAPQILQAAAAARHDQQVRPRDRATGRQRIEAGDRRRHLRRAGLALDAHRPEQHAGRKPVGEAVQDVADDRAGRRGDDADDARQVGQGALACLGEQTLRGERLAAGFEQRHQRADAGRLQRLDDDLVFRLAGERGELAGRHHFDAFFRLELEPWQRHAPDDGFQPRLVVLQREIAMARGMDAAEAGNLAAHPHIAIGILDRALQRGGYLGDGVFGDIGRGVGHGVTGEA